MSALKHLAVSPVGKQNSKLSPAFSSVLLWLGARDCVRGSVTVPHFKCGRATRR